MSLKSRKSIDRAGPDNHNETIITFRRERDRTFTKVTKVLLRDRKTGQVKSGHDKPVEDGPYELVSSTGDYDEKTKYQDLDGTDKFMYFKRLTVEETDGNE